jgi:TatD DNase family protein
LLVDTHCHLNFDSFADDRQAVLERAQAAGVERMLNPGIDVETSLAALALAESHPAIYAAVGLHPNDAVAWTDETIPALRQLARHPKAAAIGEIGIDYYWEKAPHDLQQRVLQAQLDLAAEAGLPVVIHTRNAAGSQQATLDTLDLLEAWVKTLPERAPRLVGRPGVLHSYSDDLPLARRAGALGFCIGVTGPVTFRKAQMLHEVVAGLPLEMLLIETDAPFLTPHPHRGKRNEPAYVRLVAERIAEIKNLDFDAVATATAQNAMRLFLW